MALVAIACSLIVATAALTASHSHSGTRHCDVCTSAHLPSLRPAPAALLTGPGIARWDVMLDEIPPVAEFVAGSPRGRAPPVQF
jgi:hypothetical protein